LIVSIVTKFVKGGQTRNALYSINLQLQAERP